MTPYLIFIGGVKSLQDDGSLTSRPRLGSVRCGVVVGGLLVVPETRVLEARSLYVYLPILGTSKGFV